MRQLSIFDFEENDSFEEVPTLATHHFADIVQYIEDKTGLNLERIEKDYFTVHPNRFLTISVIKERFVPEIYGGREYIAVDYDYKKTNEGGGSPLDTAEEAVNKIKYLLEKFGG